MSKEYDQEVRRWRSEINVQMMNVQNAKKTRDFYEAERKRFQRKVDLLLKEDPRQIKMEFEDETE